MSVNTYGDTGMLHTLSLSWSAKFTVVNIDAEYKLWETRFRHDEYLENVDFVIVYNCTNHFNAACMYSSCVLYFRAYLVNIPPRFCLFVQIGTF